MYRGEKIIRRTGVSTKAQPDGKSASWQLPQAIHRILSESRLARRKIKGTGVSVPGRIEEQGRRVMSAIVGWQKDYGLRRERPTNYNG